MSWGYDIGMGAEKAAQADQTHEQGNTASVLVQKMRALSVNSTTDDVLAILAMVKDDQKKHCTAEITRQAQLPFATLYDRYHIDYELAHTFIGVMICMRESRIPDNRDFPHRLWYPDDHQHAIIEKAKASPIGAAPICELEEGSLQRFADEYFHLGILKPEHIFLNEEQKKVLERCAKVAGVARAASVKLFHDTQEALKKYRWGTQWYYRKKMQQIENLALLAQKYHRTVNHEEAVFNGRMYASALKENSDMPDIAVHAKKMEDVRFYMHLMRIRTDFLLSGTALDR